MNLCTKSAAIKQEWKYNEYNWKQPYISHVALLFTEQISFFWFISDISATFGGSLANSEVAGVFVEWTPL